MIVIGPRLFVICDFIVKRLEYALSYAYSLPSYLEHKAYILFYFSVTS